jgi:hypothetical protein
MEPVPHQTRCEHVPHVERQIPSRLSAIQPANMGVRATVTSHIGRFVVLWVVLIAGVFQTDDARESRNLFDVLIVRHKLAMRLHQRDQLLVILNVPHKGLALGRPALLLLLHAL